MADTLEEQALQRKSKLKVLKSQKEKDSQSNSESTKPKLKFRSYNPQTEELKEKKLPKGKPENVEQQIQEQLDAAKDTYLGEVNLTNLAPKKVDWDLKRDIAKKLGKLERRTQRAIVELICERLQGKDGEEGKEDKLASVVAAADTGQASEDSD